MEAINSRENHIMDYNGAKEWALSCLGNGLSDKLHYHGKHHTLDVLETTAELCALEGIDPYHTRLLLTAALYHDIGFTKGNAEHEAIGCGIVREHLPGFGYTPGEISIICDMIMATKIPQSPQTRYEEILCDADLDYLGRGDFYQIGDTLYDELRAYGVLEDRLTWDNIQVKFIGNHQYFTTTNRTRREPKKQSYLTELKELVAGA